MKRFTSLDYAVDVGYMYKEEVTEHRYYLEVTNVMTHPIVSITFDRPSHFITIVDSVNHHIEYINFFPSERLSDDILFIKELAAGKITV